MRNFILIYRLSMLDLVEGGCTLGRDRAAGAGDRAGRRDPHQHRHRLARGAHPDHRHQGAARGLQLGDPQADGQGGYSAGHHQPHQRSGGGGAGAGRRRCRHGLDGAPVPRRCRLRAESRRGPRRRDQHLHRLQPGLPRPDLRRQADLLPGQPARLPRNRNAVDDGGETEKARRGRRRPGRAGLRHHGRRGAAIR